MLVRPRDVGHRRSLGAAARPGRDRRAHRPQARCAASRAALRPILCVGELLDEREAGPAEATVRASCEGALGGRARSGTACPADLVIAYEPVWAIGTGRTAQGADAAAMADAIRATVAELGAPTAGVATPCPILYGGSVTSALDRRVPRGAGHRRRARRRREPQGRRDGRHRGARRRSPPQARRRVDGRSVSPSQRDLGRGRATAPDRARHRRRLRRRPPTRGGRHRGRPDAALARSSSPTWPHCRLDASGPAVGLPVGQMGNSEVGHLNIGAGRPVLQDLPRIDAAIADGSFADNPALLRRRRSARRPRRPAAPRRARRARRRPLGRSATRSRSPRWPARTGVDGRRGPRAARRSRHAAAVGGRRSCRTSRRGSRRASRAPASRPSAVATTAWTATSAGSVRSAAYDAIVHGRGFGTPAAARCRRRDRGGLRPRRERRVRPADASSTAWTAACATATWSSTSTSAPIAPVS